MDNSQKKLTVVDLFSGAGGFSCGLEQTGVYKVAMAMEIHPQYKKTYRRNHPKVPVLGDINRLITNRRFDSVIAKLRERHGQIDVVVGGPPCQGFSSANRQRNQLISTNNLLVMSYMKFVDKLDPRAFVIENVSDMPKYDFFVSTDPWEQQALRASGVAPKAIDVTLGDVREDIDEMLRYLSGYLVDDSVQELACVQLIGYLYPQFRTLENYVRRKKLKAAGRFLDKKASFFRRAAKRVSKDSHLPAFVREPLLRLLAEIPERSASSIADLQGTVGRVTRLLSVLARMDEIHRNLVKVRSFAQKNGHVVAVMEFYNLAEHLVKYFKSKGYLVEYDKVEASKYGVPQRRERVLFIGVKKDHLRTDQVELPKPLLGDGEVYTVGDALDDLIGVDTAIVVGGHGVPFDDLVAGAPPLAGLLRNGADMLHNHVRTDTREVAQKRYNALKPGQNFHDLPAELTQSYSDPGRTQRNIYRRLKADEPSPTVTNVRKAMWVHPTLRRAISIREAARLQSFPDTYRFYGSKNDQYQQVGNAVPVLLGRAVGESVARMLGVVPETSLADVLKAHKPLRELQEVAT